MEIFNFKLICLCSICLHVRAKFRGGVRIGILVGTIVWVYFQRGGRVRLVCILYVSVLFWTLIVYMAWIYLYNQYIFLGARYIFMCESRQKKIIPPNLKQCKFMHFIQMTAHSCYLFPMSNRLSNRYKDTNI